MRNFLFYAFCLMLLSCENGNQQDDQQMVMDDFDTTSVPATFFPVGNFLSGQISDIDKSFVNPMLVRKTGDHFDTSWMTKIAFDSTIKQMIEPPIDSLKYSSYFTESKFFDQSMNAYTFTYEPNANKPDSTPWLGWTVYIDAETNEVNRIYLIRKTSPEKIRQMTWLPGKSFKAVTIVNGNNTEDDFTIKWKFDH